MLSFHAPGKAGIEVPMDAKTIPAEVNWIDAVQPDPQEIAFLERTLGIEVPTLETLSEIETSSRLRSDKDWLHLSIPMIHRKDGFMPAVTPLGFVLSRLNVTDGLLTFFFTAMLLASFFLLRAPESGKSSRILGALLGVAAAGSFMTKWDKEKEDYPGFIRKVASEKQGPHHSEGEL